MSDHTFVLDRDAARGCHAFTHKLIHEEAFEFPKDMELKHKDEFLNDLKNFLNFMVISINSEFQEITIPERYHRVYIVITQLGIISYLFGID